jgi:tetratricopeptide (TPR) repeat protein
MGEAGSDLRPWPKGGGNPAVVFFIASSLDDREFGTSSAFHVGDGLFVTCRHCLETYEKYAIVSPTGARARVDRIVAWDRSRDIAVFTVDHSPEGLGTLALSDGAIAPGENVTWCGFPECAYREESVRALGQWEIAGWGGLLALDAVTGAGSSGGPVLDVKGRAVGMIFRANFPPKPGDGREPLTEAVSTREIARLVGEGRAALAGGPSGRGALPVEEWVRRERDPWSMIPVQVHRAEWKKDFEGAAAILAERLAGKPGEVRTLALLAELRLKQGDLKAAAAAVDAALEADPGDTRSRFELAEVKRAMKEGISALAAYESCAGTRKPGMNYDELLLVCDAHCWRADLLVVRNRQEDAIAAYRDALAISPWLASEHWRMGDACCRLEDPRSAVACYGRALALRPDRPGVVLRLAVAQMLAGDAMPALETARRAVALDGKSAVASYALGCLAWRVGRVDEARAQLDTLRGLDAGLAERLSAHLDGKEDRPAVFRWSTGGDLRVLPLPDR